MEKKQALENRLYKVRGAGMVDLRSSFFSFDVLLPNCSFSTLNLSAMGKAGSKTYSVSGRRAWLSSAGLILVSINSLQQVSSSALPCFVLDTFLRILKNRLGNVFLSSP